ncbi:unnamed protein product [Chironomus riparius]|uniref:Uncharacterized protein n=1 Tax=Chironomus riparius TaxID=315576 RepID=A0A9N9RZN4_9DIPT|nr:unnamed protein product [Chironomus riparius]
MSMNIYFGNLMLLIYLHVAAFYTLFIQISLNSLIFYGSLLIMGQLGTTIAAHRYFAHRSFECIKFFRYFLVMLQSFSPFGSILHYVRYHRLHHNFIGTNADPFNLNRGFFFSYIGWLFTEAHHDVYVERKNVKMDDLNQDSMLQYQKSNYVLLTTIINFIFPTFVCVFFFNDSIISAWHMNMMRILILLHWSLMINSFGNFIGKKPYNKDITPKSSDILSLLGLGEGFNNYHYVYPWDYKASEKISTTFNISATLIDFVWMFGIVTKRYTTFIEMVERDAISNGDGSHLYAQRMAKVWADKSYIKTGDSKRDNINIWGFGDDKMSDEDKKQVKVLNY